MAKWRHRSGSTLAQVMTRYLMAPSHYLNRCWLLISEVLWHSSESDFTVSATAIILYNEFKNYTFKITATSPWGQWVKAYIIHGESNKTYKKELSSRQNTNNINIPWRKLCEENLDYIHHLFHLPFWPSILAMYKNTGIPFYWNDLISTEWNPLRITRKFLLENYQCEHLCGMCLYKILPI